MTGIALSKMLSIPLLVMESQSHGPRYGGWLSGAGWTKQADQKPVARISPRLRVLNNYYFESESVTAAPAFPVIRNYQLLWFCDCRNESSRSIIVKIETRSKVH